MRKVFVVTLFSLLIANNGQSQYSLLAKLDNDNGFNSIILGTLKSSYSGQLEGEELVGNSGNKQYMYTGDNTLYYKVYDVQFRLLVMEFDNSDRLVGFRISQRYTEEQEGKCMEDYKFLCNKITSIYGELTTYASGGSGSLNGKIWKGEEVELGVLTLDVETFGSKQLTISVKSLKLELDNNIKALNQNIAAIDKIAGFENYKFGSTMQEYGCDSWLCTKKPQNYLVGNNLVESISLNFSANSLYAIVIIFKTGDQILETLTKKYGKPLNKTVNELAYKNVQKYFWRGQKVGIEYYYDNGKYYLHYYYTTKKGLDVL